MADAQPNDSQGLTRVIHFHCFEPLKILRPTRSIFDLGASGGDSSIRTVALLSGTELRRWELTRWK